MLNEYRIETITAGQYLKQVKEDTVRSDQDVQRLSGAWNPEMKNSLIYTVLSRRFFVPNLILAEENIGYGLKQTWIVDGCQRTAALMEFRYGNYKVTSKLENYIIPYKRKKINKKGDIVRDNSGNIEWVVEQFDLRNKSFDMLPEELKEKFDGSQLSVAIYQDCSMSDVSELVRMYNNHVSMNSAQKSFTYIDKYARQIRSIVNNNRFFLDCGNYSPTEKNKGVLERVIAESVMLMNHFDNWKKLTKDVCKYLNDKASKEEFDTIDDYFTRLSPFADKEKSPDIAKLFTSKNTFIWIALFDKFTKYNLDDHRFGDFLKAFVTELQFKVFDGKNWEEIDNETGTKDKSVISRKLIYLENLLREYLNVEKKEDIYLTNDIEVFIAQNRNIDINELHEDLEFYNESLDCLLERTIRYGSKLLAKENRLSLLTMMVYSYKNDVNLDKWLEQYAANNKTYLIDQKRNFLHMKKDYENYHSIHQKSA
ncbi:MAG: hypothetical protein K2H45_13260 [Acetatifactor sp.]|nr:hypothetical protein [Acetatifactor sp.]